MGTHRLALAACLMAALSFTAAGCAHQYPPVPITSQTDQGTGGGGGDGGGGSGGY